MNQLTKLVIEKSNKPITTSKKVAEVFGKTHYNVMRDIENLDCSENFTALNFEGSKYKDDSGKINRMYLMTKDGFTFLVMGYRGKKAARFKEDYINAFNQMEEILREKQTPHWQKTRLESKANRRLETDEIKRLVDYAKSQGSKNADKYYITFSKLANKAVGLDSGQRDNATAGQLNNLVLIENIINNVIKDGIRKEIYYKEIYQDCKSRINSFLSVAYLKAV